MQHIQDTGHAPGTVVVIAASLARYSEFWLSIEALQVPHGTRLVASRGADLVSGLNRGIRRMTGDWVWLMGDDHTFDENLLLRLLNRNVDFVLPVVPRRDPPFVPVILHGPMDKTMTRYSWLELPITGLFELPQGDGCGQAGALVRKPVLEKLGDPWFEGGQLTPGMLQEDQYFVKRCQEQGTKILIDCQETMGHIANITVMPQRHGGRWYPGYVSPEGGPVLWDEPETTGWGNNIRFENIKQVA